MGQPSTQALFCVCGKDDAVDFFGVKFKRSDANPGICVIYMIDLLIQILVLVEIQQPVQNTCNDGTHLPFQSLMVI